MVINGSKVLVIIPARGGSKGLPRKNIRNICGKPLVAWSIEPALKSKYVDKVIVSTDDEEISRVSKAYGAEVPFLRPKDLSKDTSTIPEAIINTIETLERMGETFDIVISLEPTKGIREASDIDFCLEKLIRNPEAKSIVSLVPIESPSHPEWAAKINTFGFIDGPDGNLFRRQDISKRYCYSGFILISYIPFFKEKKTFFTNKAIGFILDKKEKTLDINDKTDFISTEAVMKHYFSNENIKIGIMQGRLSPRENGRYQSFPNNHWKEEFQIAKDLNFDCIEFVFDYEDYENSPIYNEEKLNEIVEVVNLTGVKVLSVCADYFMKFKLNDKDSSERKRNLEVLKKLIRNSSIIGVKDITIPFVDQSSLKSDEDFSFLHQILFEALNSAEQYGINLNLETDLPPLKFFKLVKSYNHDNLRINYDTGNSASLDYNPLNELGLYGNFVSVVHIKDRILGGGSVKLGTGNASFNDFFKKMKELKFKGPIILQAARAENYEDEINLVKEHISFLKNKLREHGHE